LDATKGFVLLAALLVVSAYFVSPFLLGNYLMMYRYDLLNPQGISFLPGVIVAVVFSAAAYFVGSMRLTRFDYIAIERRA
jgi:hypothetical protein